jgi:predicted outer membrane repeat protein
MASNCNFIGNSADSEGSGSGGGINNSWGASCALENCLFIGNSAKYAGAMSNHTGTFYIGNCTFIENTAKYGGGIRSHGGGAGSNVTINNCLFISNSAESGGGAVANIYTDLNMSNSTLWGNSVIDLGGGLYFSVDSTGIINNCVIWGNYAQQYGPQICVSFSSSAPMSSTVSVFYSDVQGGLSESYVDPECTLNWGNGNIDADPCFLNPDSNDFHLLPNSPCINAGDSNYVPEPNETDLDGNPRIDSGRIDMGAYESVYKQARLWISPQVINRRNPSPRMITAWMYLPAGVNKEQVDEDTPLVLYPGGIEAKRQFVFQNRGWFDKRTRVLAFFDRNEFLDALDTVGTVKLTVIGNLLAPGQYFFGSDSIKIISPNLPPKTIH